MNELCKQNVQFTPGLGLLLRLTGIILLRLLDKPNRTWQNTSTPDTHTHMRNAQPEVVAVCERSRRGGT